MRLFTCASCGNTVFFENVHCNQCGHSLAYLPDVRRVSAIEPTPEDPTLFVALASAAGGQRYRLCANSSEYGVCNWAVPAEDPEPYCACCRFNDVVPDASKPGNLAAWKKLEVGKHRLFYSLAQLELPMESREQRPESGLAFNFMEDLPGAKQKVMTGHANGVITINLAEADDPSRERLRNQLGEPYRTVLGHFRHEIGHYYWDRLIKETPWLPAFRELFGDEQASYQEAIQQHYANPPPADWPQHFVSSYATMHPWEDWAETWAHYLHMVDTLETARGYGLVLRLEAIDGAPQSPLATRGIEFHDFEDMLRGWLPLTVALNSLNRSMGLLDPYPFVLSNEVLRKLRFVHDVVEHANAELAIREELSSRWLKELAEEPQFKSVPPAAAAAAAAGPVVTKPSAPTPSAQHSVSHQR
jgi:hypothetical protein